MATTGTLTALQLDAAAGLLQNQGININANLTTAITSYNSTALIAPLLSTITVGSTGNILSGTTITTIETLAANSCPALSDSVPTAYSSLGVQMTQVVLAEAAVDICGSDVSKLAQAVNQAEAYTTQTSIFINSAKNSQTYLADTFTSMNNMITGDVTKVNLATGPFGTDLKNLGQLINLNNLDSFGSPLALTQQIYLIAGVIPTLVTAFVAEGISENIAFNISNPTASVTDSIQKLMYQAMTKITGDALTQILALLGVTTAGITTMADLLNPLKLFPNSYQSLTAPTANGPAAIYVNSSGSVNTALATELPTYVVSSLV
jgi:type IV secretory pathway VirB2 component (pilin)